MNRVQVHSNKNSSFSYSQVPPQEEHTVPKTLELLHNLATPRSHNKNNLLWTVFCIMAPPAKTYKSLEKSPCLCSRRTWKHFVFSLDHPPPAPSSRSLLGCERFPEFRADELIQNHILGQKEPLNQIIFSYFFTKRELKESGIDHTLILPRSLLSFPLHGDFKICPFFSFADFVSSALKV